MKTWLRTVWWYLGHSYYDPPPWAEPRPRPCAHQVRAAALIRAELVCCNLYERVNDTKEFTFGQVVHSPFWPNHSICYWGEAAARLAEGRKDG